MANKITVLVVDDEPLIRMDIADLLAEEGYRVFEAANADQAITILESNPAIRLIVTDVDMPGSMDGLKLAGAVRDRWPPVRIVVMSGHRIVGITDLPDGSVFISKPYVPAEVIGSIKKLLA